LRRVHAAAFLPLLLAVVIGCVGQHPSSYGVIVNVINNSRSEATFKWVSPGLFGTPLLAPTGAEPVPACSATYRRDFEPGHQVVTVQSAAGERTFDLDAPSLEMMYVTITIDAAGAIEQSANGEAPQTLSCV
jgi:hypothetical protein